uniref:Uncharacterized protein n=1 Tax=Guillardia theta TaxID=55529 RepID=A0A7S4UCJ9_GUITH|mmetsp:Transcript_52356/g.162511  ORF Transcript_52356/g.162511 Transcript_52356/m.162511 type:complete len:272 (+) Transcript_52356:535-1350(+)
MQSSGHTAAATWWSRRTTRLSHCHISSTPRTASSACITTRRMTSARSSSEFLGHPSVTSTRSWQISSRRCFFPVRSRLAKTEPERAIKMSELLSSLCSSPLHKLLSLRCLPHIPKRSLAFTKLRWEAVLNPLAQMQLTGWHMDEGLDWSMSPSSGSYNRAIAAMLLLRGEGWQEAETKRFKDCLHAGWSERGDNLQVLGSPQQFKGLERSSCILANCQSQAKLLDKLLERTAALRTARAFLHQYERYGTSEEDVDEAMAGLEQVISDYHHL